MTSITRRAIVISGVGLVFGGHVNARRGHKNKGKRKRRGKTRKTKRDGRMARHDRILRDVAMLTAHGFRDEGEPLDRLEARMAAGEHLSILCGTQSALGVRALQRAGYDARVVGAITKEPFGFAGADGHIMMEARLDKRWVLYDLSYNAQVVDPNGDGMSVVQRCETDKWQWRFIADDPWAAPDHQDTSGWTLGVDALLKRVLGTPWVADEEGYSLFHDPENEARIVAAFPWAHPVDAETWQALIA